MHIKYLGKLGKEIHYTRFQCFLFIYRCHWGFVQSHSIRQPAGAEVQTAGCVDAGRCWGGCTDGGLVWFFTFHETKSKSNHKWLLLFTRTRLTPVWNARMIPKQLQWRMGLAPPRPLQVTLLWPRHLKPLQPVSRQLQQVSSIHPWEKHSAIFNTILIFVSLILILTLILILMSFLNADTAKPPAKSEDLVLSVLIGLYYLYFSFLKKTVGFAIKLFFLLKEDIFLK